MSKRNRDGNYYVPLELPVREVRRLLGSLHAANEWDQTRIDSMMNDITGKPVVGYGQEVLKTRRSMSLRRQLHARMLRDLKQFQSELEDAKPVEQKP